MSEPPSLLNIHTPSSSFAIVHSLTQESLLDLYNKLSRKPNTDYYGERVGPGWLKYEYNDATWNLDDDSDYTIFAWRRQQQLQDKSHSLFSEAEVPPVASSSKTILPAPHVMEPAAGNTMNNTPTLHLNNPKRPLPSPPEYCNPSYYVFQATRVQTSVASRRSPVPSRESRRSKKGNSIFGPVEDESEDDGIPKFKKQFDRFHSENGVRTVLGSIGPVQNVRMLLKAGYRHVYISRKFAIKHEFIPPDAAPGHYGYGGLVNIGTWPITLVASSTQPNRPAAKYQRPDAFFQRASPGASHGSPGQTSPLTNTPHSSPRIPPSSSSAPAVPHVNGRTKNGRGAKPKQQQPNGNQPVGSPKVVTVEVYLSEEPHFDVVLGRSFFEKRQIKINTVDPTDVVCLDTGEKIECELVILKDGRGEIVTVT